MIGMKEILQSTGLALCGALVACAGAGPGGDQSSTNALGSADASELATLIEQVRSRHALPAAGVLVQSPGGTTSLAAVGVRKRGDSTPVTDGDLWHIGSNTKALTGTLVGTFVEEGRLRFDTPPTRRRLSRRSGRP